MCSGACRLLLRVSKQTPFNPESSPHFSGFLLPGVCSMRGYCSKKPSARRCSDGPVFTQPSDLRRVVAQIAKHLRIVFAQLRPDPFG